MATQAVRKVADLDADKALFRLQGIVGTITAGGTGHIEWKLPEARWVDAGELILENHASMDSIKIQVVDSEGLLGAGAGYVLDEYGTDIQIATDVQNQGIKACPYVALVPAYMYIRLVYTSTGEEDVIIKLNLFTHKPRV